MRVYSSALFDALTHLKVISLRYQSQPQAFTDYQRDSIMC